MTPKYGDVLVWGGPAFTTLAMYIGPGFEDDSVWQAVVLSDTGPIWHNDVGTLVEFAADDIGSGWKVEDDVR